MDWRKDSIGTLCVFIQEAQSAHTVTSQRLKYDVIVYIRRRKCESDISIHANYFVIGNIMKKN